MSQQPNIFDTIYCTDCGEQCEEKMGEVYDRWVSHKGDDEVDCETISKCCDAEIEHGYADDDGNRYKRVNTKDIMPVYALYNDAQSGGT